ncbi:uncharacterized protein PAC_01527 [Phialocephala subalpina]|uniref:RGS domain-containing protein n=1 Tax=Phialocephala subalpina TaxID=576137 RepID=A0A1L7WFV1_9HELO|nr:uncharacterized protein PAC_01527 [Phialocephala subalpina]
MDSNDGRADEAQVNLQKAYEIISLYRDRALHPPAYFAYPDFDVFEFFEKFPRHCWHPDLQSPTVSSNLTMTSTSFVEPSFFRTLLNVITFRRPEKLPSAAALQIIRGQAITSKSVPEEISFDTMMSGGTLPPITKAEFKTYLSSINDSEYVDFLECLEHYAKLFEAFDGKYKSALSAPFTKEDEDITRAAVAAAVRASRAALANVPITLGHSGPITPAHKPAPMVPNLPGTVASSSTVVQRLSEEANWIKDTFIVQHAPEQLNLDHRTREIILYALKRSNHPTAFGLAVECAKANLRRHYAEFLKVSAPTTNTTRIIMAYLISMSLLVSGIGFSFFVIFSKQSRFWRLLSFPLVSLGIALLYATQCRLSVVLYPLGHYQIKPWDIELNCLSPERLSSIHPDNFLAGEVDPESREWVQRYNRRFLIRKTFDKEGPIQDAQLRYGELMLVGQALWAGTLIGLVLVGGLLGVPPQDMW